MRSSDSTKRLAQAAVCVALSAAVIAISAFTPAQIVPLIFVSLCIYVAFRKTGIVYGILTAIASAAISFGFGGLRVTFFFTIIFFIPYAILCFSMQKLSYKVVWQAVIRILLTAALVAGAFFALLAITDAVAGTMIMKLVERAGTWLAAGAVVLATLPLDLFFSHVAEKVICKIK